jgi:hypothetical protein
MKKISKLEFVGDGKVKAYFFRRKSEIFEISVKGIQENGNKVYYRITINNNIAWCDEDSIRVPSSLEHNLEKLARNITKSTNLN